MLEDLDGDKIRDIAVANNGRSRIDLLLSGKKPAEAGNGGGRSKEPNEVASDRRMRLVSVPVNKEVVSLTSGDFNGDGKADLAFYGTPAELVVMLNDGKGEFAQSKRLNTGEAVEGSTSLMAADLNRDGRDDLVLLAAKELVLVYQDSKGQLGEPERLPHTAGSPHMMRAVDLDGDGGNDIVILDGDSDDPVRVRFSVEGGKLGPEQRFQVEAPKAIAFANVDGRPGAELLTVEGQSGRPGLIPTTRRMVRFSQRSRRWTRRPPARAAFSSSGSARSAISSSRSGPFAAIRRHHAGDRISLLDDPPLRRLCRGAGPLRRGAGRRAARAACAVRLAGACADGCGRAASIASTICRPRRGPRSMRGCSGRRCRSGRGSPRALRTRTPISSAITSTRSTGRPSSS